MVAAIAIMADQTLIAIQITITPAIMRKIQLVQIMALKRILSNRISSIRNASQGREVGVYQGRLGLVAKMLKVAVSVKTKRSKNLRPRKLSHKLLMLPHFKTISSNRLILDRQDRTSNKRINGGQKPLPIPILGRLTTNQAFLLTKII